MIDIEDLVLKFDDACGGIPARPPTMPSPEEKAIIMALRDAHLHSTACCGRRFSTYKQMAGGPVRLRIETK
jgi:hypothetical protein